MSRDGKVVDTHVHITSPEIIANIEEYRRFEPYFDLLCSSSVNKNITGEELVTQMEQNQVDKAVVFGFGFQSMDLCKKVNDYTIKMINKFPDKLTGLAVVNPGEPGVKEELKRSFKAGLKGVGELFPEGQNFNLEDKKSIEVVTNFCRENGCPLLIHLNEPVGHYYKGKTGDSIIKGEKLAQNFPDTNIIFAHLGGGLCFYELMPEIQEDLSNVYYDTAAVPFLYRKRVYETLKSAGLSDKILFGSDYPLIDPGRYIKDINNTNLNKKDKQKILNKNISKIIDI